MPQATAKQAAPENSTVNAEEVERFSRIADEWWDEKGKFKPLHKINPVRLGFIRDHAARHFGRDGTKIRALDGLSVLDIGCGGGLLCEPLTRLGARVTGIDASEKNIKVASLHAENMGLEIDYRNATAEALAEDSKRYDAVLALEIIEHVDNVPLFMQSVCKLVKPGGLLFLSTLNRTLKSYAMAILGAEYLLRWLPVGTHDWNKFLRPSEIAAHLRVQRMDIIEQTGMTFSPLYGSWSLHAHDLDVNYLLVAHKPITDNLRN